MLVHKVPTSQAVDHLARHSLLCDHQLDVLREVLRMAE
jgi:hypothetical protein